MRVHPWPGSMLHPNTCSVCHAWLAAPWMHELINQSHWQWRYIRRWNVLKAKVLENILDVPYGHSPYIGFQYRGFYCLLNPWISLEYPCLDLETRICVFDSTRSPSLVMRVLFLYPFLCAFQLFERLYLAANTWSFASWSITLLRNHSTSCLFPSMLSFTNVLISSSITFTWSCMFCFTSDPNLAGPFQFYSRFSTWSSHLQLYLKCNDNCM